MDGLGGPSYRGARTMRAYCGKMLESTVARFFEFGDLVQQSRVDLFQPSVVEDFVSLDIG